MNDLERMLVELSDAGWYPSLRVSEGASGRRSWVAEAGRVEVDGASARFVPRTARGSTPTQAVAALAAHLIREAVTA